MSKKYTIFFSFVIVYYLLFNNNHVFAQGYIVQGNISDSITHQPIRNASIKWLHQKRGTITDSLGIFHLYSSSATDTLQISCIGYTPILFPINVRFHDNLTISLIETNNMLQDVIVYPKGYDPAISLFKKILKHKVFNNPDLLYTLQYDIYHSLEIDVTHLSNKMIQTRWLSPFKQYFLDSAHKLDSKLSAPVFLNEQTGSYQYSKVNHQSNYKIYKQKISGIKNESIIHYMNEFNIPINIYSNYISLLKTEFISPIAVNGLRHYHYTISDTCVKGSEIFYKLQFTPFSTGGNTFIGYVWVDSKRYAITEINMITSKSANLNWIESISLHQQFHLTNAYVYALTANNIEIQFKLLSKKQPAFSAIQKELYTNIQVNLPITTLQEKEYLDGNKFEIYKQAANTIINSGFVGFDNSKKSIYQKIDSLNKIPAFKTYSSIFKTLATGYFPIGKIDVGNLYKSFTSNYFEGKRFNLGMRTNDHFSKAVQLGGYLGVGMKDKEPRYTFHTLFVLNHDAWETIRFNWQKDFSPLKENADELNENSLFGSLLLRIPRSQIYLVDNQSFQIQYQKFYKNGFSFHIQTSTNQLAPLFNSYFTYLNYKPILVDDPNPLVDGYRDNHLSVGVRYAFKEKYITSSFRRKSISSQLPIIDFTFTNGITSKINIIRSDLSYQKFHFSLSQKVMINGVGNLRYVFNAGFTNGILPLMLLEVAKGNDTYYYNPYAYNNMFRYEFVSDRYFSLFAEQQLGGFPFSHIPLMYRLKWRSVLSIRALEGTMTSANKIANMYNTSSINFHFKVPDQLPYTELGYGIDNIFHVLRLDAIWRLTYLQQPNTPAFGIRASLHFMF
ncbi:MAG: carboxypeptidase-like regulatory domain-containing protein [Bacteroidota bacterium]|nr:carboxypeptidase-like regulatory domain-containing protein [Bacteroidota bacterium]